MTTVVINDKYVDVLSALGDLNEAAELAFRRYTIEQITNKISVLKKRNHAFEVKYGMSFPEFSQKIAVDEDYVETVENNINPLWEADLLEWEFSHKGALDWTQELQTILLA